MSEVYDADFYEYLIYALQDDLKSTSIFHDRILIIYKHKLYCDEINKIFMPLFLNLSSLTARLVNTLSL